ncbi:hypothetical protein IP68_02300 [Blastomonas sp. AAP25]|nr:hypothetical protein IP68_02300 [Blastomonas sp. AAP25]
MEELAISQSELARRVGVSQTTIYKLVSGDGYGSKYLHKIARELQTTAAYLSGETDDPSTETPILALDYQQRQLIEYFNKLGEPERNSFIIIMRSAVEGPSKHNTLHNDRSAFRAEDDERVFKAGA